MIRVPIYIYFFYTHIHPYVYTGFDRELWDNISDLDRQRIRHDRKIANEARYIYVYMYMYEYIYVYS
jgi:hypothetical protein